MYSEDELTLALVAWEATNKSETDAIRMLRDECGMSLVQGLKLLRAAVQFKERLENPK